MLSVLIDLDSGEFFSKKRGWNRQEATVLDSKEWSFAVYHHSFFLGSHQEGWLDRRMYIVPFPIPAEPEILT